MIFYKVDMLCDNLWLHDCRLASIYFGPECVTVLCFFFKYFIVPVVRYDFGRVRTFSAFPTERQFVFFLRQLPSFHRKWKNTRKTPRESER